MGIYKRGDTYWYRFNWYGKQIRESTKQGNPRVARQIEAAHKTALAKGEVGIREKKPSPTLKEFAEQDFLPYVRATSASKPRTVTFYTTTVKNLIAFPKLASASLNSITAELIATFVAKRQSEGMQTSTINRDLATLRRMFHLAQEWNKVSTVLPRVRMLAGENQRERVLSEKEEQRFLTAATELGNELEATYQRALEGIRATLRFESPIKPDAYLLRDVTTILIDCGLRPEECYRLRWENIRDGAVEIFTGKRRASRRRIPASSRVLSILAMRREISTSDWIFPAPTASGHIEGSSLKKQHQKALVSSKVRKFVLYDLRHTCLTRWAKVMDAFTLKTLAGHTDLNTTMRYVHLNDSDVRIAMEKAQRWAQIEHSDTIDLAEPIAESQVIN
jgi:integrase